MEKSEIFQRYLAISSPLSALNPPQDDSVVADEEQPLAGDATFSDLEVEIPERQRNSTETAQLPNIDPNETSEIAPDTVRILTPESGIARSRATTLAIQYNANSSVVVRLNGDPLPEEVSSTIEQDETSNTTTQIFYNIPLKNGENTLTAIANGGEPTTLQLTVESQTVKLEFFPVGDPRIPADKRSTVDLEGTLTDEEGARIEEDTVITLTASAGEFIGADYDEDQAGFQVLAVDGTFSAKLQSTLETQKVRIRAAIEPTGLRSDFAFSQLDDEPIETYTNVEFITYLRPSLVSGVVDFRIGPSGTNFWGSRSVFLNPDVIQEGTRADLRGAMFATGSLGEWLFTGAVNSERPLNQTCDGITRLFRGPQFCEQQYPVYGDSSTVDYTTPSTDSFYVRLERTSPVPDAGSDYFMWGDYHTEELSQPSQEFSAFTRELHGFKGNYNLGDLQISALFSPDVKGFQRDTLVPDGTSGYYFLSRRNLVPGSETIFVEMEEINRPGTVIKREQLFRGPDYEIDYDRGTLLFRRPMQEVGFELVEDRRGREMTVVRKIVTSYQFEGNGNEDTYILAGRLQYNVSRDVEAPIWLGATYFRENQGGQNYELFGADFLVSLGRLPESNKERGRIVGEFAHSNADNTSTLGRNTTFPIINNTTDPRGDSSGSAYRLEFVGNLSEYISARAYLRSVSEGFSNNSTLSFTPGQTRYGAEVSAELSPATTIRASYDHESNFGLAPAVRTQLFDLFNPAVDLFSPTVEALPGSPVDNELTTIRAGVIQKIGRTDLSVEYVNRSRSDDVSGTFDANTSQFVTNLRVPIFCEDSECEETILAFRAQNELSLGGDDPLYPDRTTVGLEWAVQPGVKLRLAHQFYDGGLLGDNSITSVDTIVDRKMGENTNITSRYSVVSGVNGMTSQSAIGLTHRWPIAPGLAMDFGYERITSDVFGETAAGPRFRQPFAVGQSASSLGFSSGDSYSVGIQYTANPDFKASARFEQRNSTGGNNTVVIASAAGKISPALTALMRFQYASSATPFLQGLGDTTKFRLGVAYRDPNDDRFNGLFRYEYRNDPSTIPDTLLFGSGTGSSEHIVSTDWIYAPNWQWEFYGKYAMRFSQTSLADNFSNSSTIHLGQLRATYRFAYQFDVSLEGRVITQPSANFTELGFAAELGYYLTPDLRLGLGYSFGSVDDRDFSGYRSNDGIFFGITFKVNELFGDFGRQQVTPPQQEESEVLPIATGQNEPTFAIVDLLLERAYQQTRGNAVSVHSEPGGITNSDP
ncbi:hypothetical protein [Lusitaniella coriacea]|uniref:hypothetical protein n=1 Tax=Lusitaniella coriacea TaxID=1983105 RepID=UPI003CE83E91